MCDDDTLYDNFHRPCDHDEDDDGIHDDFDACPQIGDRGDGIGEDGCPANIEPTEEIPVTATPSPLTFSGSICINLNGAWLRSEPDAASQEILSTLSYGQEISLTGQQQAETGTSNGQEYFQWWWQVSTNGVTGWVEE